MKKVIWLLTILFFSVSCEKDALNEYPLIQTGDVTDISTEGAVFNAKIIDLSTNDIMEYGFVWGLEDAPTIKSSQVIIAQPALKGIINERITNDLIPNMLYSVRAFAKNNSFTTYGKTVTFLSLGSTPPEILDFSPKTGSNNTEITIIGKNFSGGALGNFVHLGNVIAVIIEASAEKLIVKLPDNITVSGKLKINVQTANHSVFSNETFLLEGCLIEGFAPKSVLGGENIFIKALNYNPIPAENTLLVGGEPIDIIEIRQDTLVAEIPFNARIGLNQISLQANGKTNFFEDSVQVLNPWSQITSDRLFYRAEAVGFTIGDELFIGLGQNINSTMRYRAFDDLWKYNILDNNWTECAPLPDTARTSAIGFSINNTGYVGLGNYAGWIFFNSFYAYEPQSNQWIRKADFPGIARRTAFSLVIGEKAYVGLGTVGLESVNGSTSLDDFWEYDPELDKWTQLSDFPSRASIPVTGFEYNGKGYYMDVVYNESYQLQNEFWEYNPQTDEWTRLNDFPGLSRRQAVGFSDKTNGYIGFGWNTDRKSLNDMWKYNVDNDSWSRIPDSPYEPRYNCVAFPYEEKVFIGAGINNDSAWGNHKESFIVLTPNL